MIIKTVVVGMLHTNCYLVMDEKTKAAMVVDPGSACERILAQAEAMNADIQAIVLTHGHFDHVMAAPGLQEATGAKVYIHPSEAGLLDADTVRHRGYIKEEYKRPTVEGELTDGMELGIGSLTFTVRHTPGHTIGSCVLLCQEDGQRIMLSGDTLFLQNVGRWDLEGGDEGQLMNSLSLLHDLAGDYTVYPGHGETTTLEYERKTNPYMKRGESR